MRRVCLSLVLRGAPGFRRHPRLQPAVECQPETDAPKYVAPRQGLQRQCARLRRLPPLGGVECFWGGLVPAVSLRSTAGYHLCSLREQSPPA
jgi:hypothetical protein